MPRLYFGAVPAKSLQNCVSNDAAAHASTGTRRSANCPSDASTRVITTPRLVEVQVPRSKMRVECELALARLMERAEQTFFVDVKRSRVQVARSDGRVDHSVAVGIADVDV